MLNQIIYKSGFTRKFCGPAVDGLLMMMMRIWPYGNICGYILYRRGRRAEAGARKAIVENYCVVDCGFLALGSVKISPQAMNTVLGC